MQQDQDIQLNPIIDAVPVQFTTDTIGWKILFIMLFFLLGYMVYKYYLGYKKKAYRREAVSIIEDLAQDNKSSMSFLISQIMFQLKQTALQSYDRKTVASLEGKGWLLFLDNKIKQPSFSRHHDVIASAVYKNEFNENDSFTINEFAAMSINWIKKHA